MNASENNHEPFCLSHWQEGWGRPSLEVCAEARSLDAGVGAQTDLTSVEGETAKSIKI